jgi:hypothetical protein
MILNCSVSVSWFTKSTLVVAGESNVNSSLFSFSLGLQEEISKSMIKTGADLFISELYWRNVLKI